jgi:YidC/Oxa1 family membrane protein insertase
MNPWTALVHLVQRGFTATGDILGGSLATGIFALTLVVRIAMIPVMLPLARKTRRWRAIQKTLRPEIREISTQYKSDPSAQQRELKALHSRHGIGQVDGAGLLMALLQVPVLIAFFQAVLHISDGTALASGGLLAGVVAGGISFVGTQLGDATTPRALLYLSGILPVIIGAWLGLGIGLYLIAFYLGSLLQSLIMRRDGQEVVAPVA